MTKYFNLIYFGAAIGQEEALHVVDLRVRDAAQIRADVHDKGLGQVKIDRIVAIAAALSNGSRHLINLVGEMTFTLYDSAI